MGARKTVLEITQDILSSMDSDSINDISDTVEADQVVDIIEETYYELLSRVELDYHQRLEQLESVSDVNQPVKIKIPEGYVEILNFKYRVDDGTGREEWKDIRYETPGEFLHKVQRRDNTLTEVDKITTDSGVPIYIYNERAPSFWTSFDNQFIYTDAIDLSVDTTLQESKTTVLARIQPNFVRSNNAIPDIPTQLFPYLINESKSKAFINLKQQANDKVELIARRQFVTMRERNDRVDRTRRFVDYGR